MCKAKIGYRFCPEICDRIVEVLSQGNYRTAAAKAVNISDKTLSQWLNLPDKKYAEFQKRVSEAEAQIEIRAVKAITESGDKDAKWWCWYLERKFPKRWNTGLHRWEMQILQKQVKDLRHAIQSLTKNAEGNQDPTEEIAESSDEQDSEGS